MARLPIYHWALAEAARQRITTVSSERLAAMAGVNAAKVRKDLSYLGSYGWRGIGYDVTHLLSQISDELGLSHDSPVVIVGAGNLGRALASYPGLSARGFRVVALLDSDPARLGERMNGLVVQPVGELEGIVAQRQPEIGVIATPASVAHEMAGRLVAAGVTSILSFAPAVLGVPTGVALRKVDLSIELQILSFYRRQAGSFASP